MTSLHQATVAEGPSTVRYSQEMTLPDAQVVSLYQARGWSSAEKPEQLLAGLRNSHRLVTAWDSDLLIGLGNTLSDGHLVVYYSHLLVLPEYAGQGVGREIMQRLMSHYQGFHQQVLVADGQATGFFARMGFRPAGQTRSMWIYDGHDH